MTWTFVLPIDLRSKNRVANARDHRLSGAIEPSGNKNSALPIIS